MARIVSVDIARVDYPLVGEFKFFKSRCAADHRAAPDRRERRRGLGPVRAGRDLDLRDGRIASRPTLRHYLAPAILGADPSDIADVHARMERAIRPSFSVGQPLCKAAIDLACYDLWGKQTRQAGQRSARRRDEQDRNQAELDGQVADARGRRTAARAGPRARLRQLQRQGRLSADARLTISSSCALVTSFAPHGFHWCDANTSYDLDTALDDGAEARRSRPQERWNRRCRRTASATIRRSSARARCRS